MDLSTEKFDPWSCTSQNDFESFLLDSYIRGFSIAESLYEDLETFSKEDRMRFCAPLAEQSDLWKRIFAHRVSVLNQQVTVSNGEKSLSLEKIGFHFRFGWIVEGGGIKAYLGKTTLTEGTQLSIGNRSYFSGHGTIRGGALLSIGNYCNIGEGVYAHTGHDFHPISYPSVLNWAKNYRLLEDHLTFPIDYKDLADAHIGVKIGHDVWLGRNVRILHGVKVGNGAVVAEGSFVNRDCEPYGIYAGIPARLKGHRFEPHVIETLQDLEWWLWPPETVREKSDFFRTRLKDVDAIPAEIIQKIGKT